MPPRLLGSAEAFRGLCEANGINEKVAQEDPVSVKTIEMFLFNFSKIQSLETFTGLNTLIICQQAINEIEGLETLINLEKLWICETNVSRIQGLENCTKLQHLHLYSNRIKVVEGLDRLTMLERLWIMDNQLTRLENLEPLVNLQSLSVARNQIRAVGNVLDNCVVLTDLNVAGNQLWSFKDLLNLTRASSLRRLAFSDCDYGDNPVCELCNYQTYVYFHLPQLQHLDTLPIPEEGKVLAEATYMKKKMYYNMRIKTLKRNASNIIRKATEAFNKRKEQLFQSLNVLLRLQKDLQRVMWEQGGGGSGYDTKANKVREAVAQCWNLIATGEAQLESLRDCVCGLAEHNASRLIVELETGGNIRLEDGKPSDVWYSSCVDLIQSRFFAKDFAALGITGLQVTRVTRIHNRFLRNRFEEKLEETVDVTDSSYKKSLEYLFFGEDPRLPGEALRVAEEGFRSCDEYETLGFDGAVPLSNSVSLADMPRLLAAVARHYHAAHDAHNPLSSPTSGRILITKVFLPARCTAERGSTAPSSAPKPDSPAPAEPTTPTAAPAAAAAGDGRGGTAGGPVRRSTYSKHDAVYRVKKDDPKQRTWFVFEEGLVLPEYIIEFDYLGGLYGRGGTGGDPPASFAAAVLQEGSNPLQPHSESEAADLGPMARALVQFIYLTAPPALEHPDGQSDASLASGGEGAKGSLEALVAGLVNMPPLMATPTALTTVDPKAIASLSKTSVDLLPSLKVLVLHSCGLQRMQHLALLPSLEELVLSFNEMSRLEGLEACTRLTLLDVSFNLIRRLDSLNGLTTLHNLDCQSNLINRVEDVSMMRKHVPNLVDINLANNPLCDMKSFRAFLLRRLHHLKRINGLGVSTQELEAALATTSSIKVWLIKENAFVQRRGNWSLLPPRYRRQTLGDRQALQLRGQPRDIALQAGGGAGRSRVESLQAWSRRAAWGSGTEGGGPGGVAGGHGKEEGGREVNKEWSESDDDEEAPPGSGALGGGRHGKGGAGWRIEEQDDEDERWWVKVQDLELNHRNLRKVAHLERLKNLRVLSMCDNELTSIKGVESLCQLEELLLEENRITKMEGLAALSRLKKLDLGKNRISRIEGVEGLCMLQQLSLEDNQVEGLSGLEKLTSLMEIYLGNNRIPDLKELIMLRSLPKVVILDLSGNPVVNLASYRLFALFHLKRLKVLDGLGVEPSEQAAANDVYVGRLTEEVLLDKIGHRFWEALMELDLSSSKIRDLAGYLSPSSFPAIRMLNLDNNGLQDLSGLTGLSTLVVLRINHNRLDSLFPDKVERRVSSTEMPTGALQTLLSLEVLQAGFNEITTLAACRTLRLSALKVLFLQGNEVTRLDGLEPLTSLRELVVDKNKIRLMDLPTLGQLVHLREIRMEDNGLKSLHNLSPLPKLLSLHLSSNRIADIAELDKLLPMLSLIELSLANNPIARKQMYRATVIQKVGTLRVLDNKEISLEERERVDCLFGLDSRAAGMRTDAGWAAMPGQREGMSVVIGLGSSTVPPGAASSGGKMPVKMVSMTFDQHGGGAGVGPLLGFGPGQGVAPPPGGRGASEALNNGSSLLCIGLSKGPGGAGGSAVDNGTGADGAWHPFHSAPNDFFIRARIRGQSLNAPSHDEALNSQSSAAAAAAATAAAAANLSGPERSSSSTRLSLMSNRPLAANSALRPRSGDRPTQGSDGRASVAGAGASAAAVASAALEARAVAAGLPGHRYRRSGGFVAGGQMGGGSNYTPRSSQVPRNMSPARQ